MKRKKAFPIDIYSRCIKDDLNDGTKFTIVCLGGFRQKLKMCIDIIKYGEINYALDKDATKSLFEKSIKDYDI